MDTSSLSVTQNNQALLNRKRWENMQILPAVTATGHIIIAGNSGVVNDAMLIQSTSAQYLYHHDEDAFVPITSGSFAGTFAVGTCGVRHPWSITYTANGGSTTTITVNTATHNLCGIVIGQTVEFLSGTADNIGLRRTITQIYAPTAGQAGNITLTLDSAVTAVVANNDTFRISSGRYFVLSAYTASTFASGVFKVFDVGTLAWQASLSTTNLPASWGTAGNMVLAYSRFDIFDTGTATSGSATTLVDTGAAWAVDKLIGKQLRITAGTGRGQIRRITDNDATSITIASGATLDNTSQYSIEGNEDVIYLLGNGSITMYTYTISSNTWAVVSPAVARVGAPTTCMLADWVGVTGDTDWATNCLDGNYIYSPRGAGSVTITRYDISSNSWETVTHAGATTFTTGADSCQYGRYIYYAVNAAAGSDIYKYSVRGNYTEPFAKSVYTQSTVFNGQKMWFKKFDTAGNIIWLYRILHSSTVMQRLMVF